MVVGQDGEVPWMPEPFEGPPTGSVAAGAHAPRTGATTLGGDIAQFGTAVFLSVVLGVVQLFVVPRRLDLVTYGQYRLFLVFVGYLGVVHLGIVDGAFVRWAGRAPAVVREEWRRVASWLLAMHGTVLLAALFAAAATSRPLPRTYLVAFAAGALSMNGAVFTGFVLQSLRDFRGAGAVAILPPATFVISVLVLPDRPLAAVLAAWVASYGLAAIAGAMRVLQVLARATADSAPPAARTPLTFASMLRVGIPVLGATLAAGVSQFGDRIVVGLAVPITSFALYGFASSAMVAAIAATNVLSRVALSHAAWRTGARRASFFGGMYDVIGASFGIAIASVPLFEHVVARVLPVYADALPIVRALVAGSLFWMAMRVVLVGILQTYGFVRTQFALELAGAALVAIAVVGSLAAHAPLWGIATAAASAAAVTWSLGVVFVGRVVPDARRLGSMRFAATGAAQFFALAVSLAMPAGWLWQSVVYVALASLPTGLAARRALAHMRQ